MSYFVLSLLPIFLRTKTNIVTNLDPLNPDKNLLSLFLIADSVYLSCSSVLKEFKISILQELT